MDTEHYYTVMGSDVQRDGMFLELWEKAGERCMGEAFYTDQDGSLRYTEYLEGVPEIVVGQFQIEARKRLPPERKD